MKKIILTAALLVLAVCAMAQTEEKIERLDSVVVSASRAGASTPVSYSMLSREELRSAPPAASLPMALSLQPSVIVMNEGGTGLGYSRMTIRGSKGTQINVTLNGITLNDAESQEVFWVNIPALASLLSSVQIQRGLGTSAGGTGAFGANVNMSTASVSPQPHGLAELGYGSYHTLTGTVQAHTGLLKNGLYFATAYSYGRTDGYIQNAWGRVQSAYAALGWLHGPHSLRLTWLMGEQHTGITWNGISLEQYALDRRHNDAGQFHDNESDNYRQQHFQLNYTRAFGSGWYWSTTLNGTTGRGYYEQFKQEKKFSKYGWSKEAQVGGHPASAKSDFIIRKWMDNRYGVLHSELKYAGERLKAVGGASLSQYDGDHFGAVIWNSLLGEDFDYEALNAPDARNNWYYNSSRKRELDLFARAEWEPAEALTLYADMQLRGLSLRMAGIDDEDELPLDGTQRWRFFQPRAGLSWRPTAAQKFYASLALGQREPSRSDLKEVIASQNLGGDLPDLRPEKMLDIEAGYTYTTERLAAGANLYLMEYRDMLLETGRLSDSGYPIKNNVGRAFRRGIKLTAAWEAAPWLRVEGNTTLSLNRLRRYDDSAAAIDAAWNELGYSVLYAHFDRTPILMSPAFIGMARLTLRPFCRSGKALAATALVLDLKGVGKQYLDNTGDPDRVVPAYAVCNLSLSNEFPLRAARLGLSLYVGNLFNRDYYADGGVWKYWNVDTRSLESGVWIYPQALRNLSCKIYYRF